MPSRRNTIIGGWLLLGIISLPPQVSADGATHPVKLKNAMSKTPATGLQATQLAPTYVYGSINPDELVQADAASTGLITQEQIAYRPISRPAEVLEFVPGLVATQHSGDGKANQYFLRGFNLDHGTDLSASIDGVPNNLRTHAHGQGYNDLNALIPELIETIEYRKGPYYAEDGDFSSAGAVRLRYKNRLAHPFAQLTSGQYGYQRALLAGSTALGDTSHLLLALDAGVYDGPWDKPENEHRGSLLAKYTSGTVEDGYGLEFVGYQNRWDSSDQIPLRAVQSKQIDPFGQIDPDLGGRTSRYTLSGDLHRPLGDGHLLLNAYAVHYSLNLFSNFTYFLNDPLHGDEFEQTDNRNYYGGQAKYITQWNTGGVAQGLAFGVQARADDISRVGLYHTQARQRIGTTRQDAVKENSVALFVSYDARWTDWLRSVAGVRSDFYQATVDSDIAANSGSAHDHSVSPKLSVILGPWLRSEFFLNAGRGFHSNDARGATLQVDPADPAQAASPQKLIVPTTGEELGVRTSPTDTLTLTAALWRLKIGSELVFSGDGGTTEPSYPSRRHGIELSADYQALPWLAINADYAAAHGRFAHNPAGDRIPNAVESVASIGIDAHGDSPWSAGLRYRFLGPAPLIEDNSVRSHSTTVVNAQLGYAFNTRLKLTMEVLNALDSKDNDITYYYASQLAGEKQPVDDIHFHPVEPRNVRLTLRMDL
ncbi:MAG: TonB-dependent receptor [Pseudomonadota bacterium]|nr:TonB-dependent receptor [Pseudomonadota bacterium]